MPHPRVEEMGEGRQLLDLDFRDTEGLVAAYLVPAEGGWTLIETGPASCRCGTRSGTAPCVAAILRQL